MAPSALPNLIDTPTEGEFVFEGPEKKLEVYFSSGPHTDGFRRFDQTVWSDLLVAASCSILNHTPNSHFDAYLLSESSLFVYPNRVILKTCGTTGLLLVLPKLLALASSLSVVAEHVHYGHYRYKFPEQQLYPHSSFDQESEYLRQVFGSVESRVLGPEDGRCWYALCTRQQPPLLAPPVTPHAGDDLFEIAMEGLPLTVCKQFFESSHPSLTGRRLAKHMTDISGIGALLPDVTIDDWAFEPCGYSMNGLRGEYYYTIHITPEYDFSYASFETNDPEYRKPKWVEAVTAVFQPTVFTVTLTTRSGANELPSYTLDGFDRGSRELATFDTVSMCSMNFHADARGMHKRKLEEASIKSGTSAATMEFSASDSEGSSEVNSEVETSWDMSSVNGEQVDMREEGMVATDALVLAGC